MTVSTAIAPAPADTARARELLSLARTIVLTRAPYIGPMLAKLIVVWKPGLGTFGVTERGHLLIDPATLVQWSDEEGIEVIAGVLFHEVMHVVLHHAKRSREGGFAHRRYNVAADLFINGNATECGFTLPSCGIFPETIEHSTGKAPWAKPTPWKCADGSVVTMPAGLTAEEYYDRLPTPPESDESGQGEGGEGGEGSDGDAAPQRADGREGGPADGNCGSGAGGEPLDGEPEAGEVDEDGAEIGERSAGELEQASEAVARKAAEHAKGCGKIGGGFKVWAEAALRPAEVPWNRVLRRRGRSVTDRLGRGRQTYKRPHRRAVCLGNHPRNPLLAVHEETTCVVWFAVDTSGSMSLDEHVTCVSELLGIVKRGGEVYLLACDARVQGEPVKLPKSLNAAKSMIKGLLAGGGGTDFRPIFEEAAKAPRRTRPDLIVVGTDAGGPAPATDPGFPTIWLSTTGARPYGCGWGDLIPVKRGA